MLIETSELPEKIRRRAEVLQFRGPDEFPFGYYVALATDEFAMSATDVVDLEERMERARESLEEQASGRGFRSATERARLNGKAQGVGLALSYLREYRR